MFMTNLELVYGKNKTNAGTFKLSAPTEHDIVSSSYYESGSISGNSETSFVQSDTDILKSDDTKQKIGVLSNKLKNVAGIAASSASGFAKNVIETAKSDETATKISSLKEKMHFPREKTDIIVSVKNHNPSQSSDLLRNNSVDNHIIANEEHYCENNIENTMENSIFFDDGYDPAYYEDTSKKPVIIGIIVGMSICVVLAGGIFGGMHLIKNKKSSDINNVSTIVSDSINSIDNSTDDLSNTIPSQENVDKNKIKEAYIKTMKEFKNPDGLEEDIAHPYKYALYDIDNDGIEELIIQCETIVGNYETLYYYNNGEYTEIASCSESSFQISPEEHCVQWYGYGGYESRSVLKLSKQGNIIDELHIEYYPSEQCIKNGVAISQQEYESIMAKYDALNWVKPHFNKFSSVISESSSETTTDTTQIPTTEPQLPPQISFSKNINDYPLYNQRLKYIISLINQGYGYNEFRETELSINYSLGTDSLSNIGYALIDLNSDGLPELVTVEKNNSKIIEVYTIYNNQLICLCQSAERYYYVLSENNIIYCSGSSSASTGGISYYKYENGSSLVNLFNIEYEYYMEGVEPYYYKNGEWISNNEAESIINSYQTVNIDSILFSTISSNNNYEKVYSIEDILSNAGYDFYFYNEDFVIRTVCVQEGSLNLRSKPSMDGEIITKLPKGTAIAEYGYNNEWSMIIYYTDDGESYPGYVSRQFLQ